MGPEGRASSVRASRAWRALPARLRLLSVSSIQIGLRPERIRAAGVRFDERFGLGADFPSCEEAIFLWDCLSAGLRIEWTDRAVAGHAEESSGRVYADPEIAIAKGAMLARLFGRARPLAALLFAYRSRGLFRENYDLRAFLRALEEGGRRYRERPA